MQIIPHFHLDGAAAATINGKTTVVRQQWNTGDLLGKWTILAIFPSSHTPVCQATCLGLAKHRVELDALGAQAFGLCNNFIADVEAWVHAQAIAIPVLSDFLARTTTGYLAGINADGTARRATFLLDPQGRTVWEHRDCEAAEHHVEEALKALRQAASGAGRAQEAAVSDSLPAPVSEALEAMKTPQGASLALPSTAEQRAEAEAMLAELGLPQRTE